MKGIKKGTWTVEDRSLTGQKQRTGGKIARTFVILIGAIIPMQICTVPTVARATEPGAMFGQV
jgi:hypothetical protein